MTDRATPNLPSRDFDDTITFYGGFGFELSYRDAGAAALLGQRVGFLVDIDGTQLSLIENTEPAH